VVGGGNTAVEEALYLSNIAKHVTLIHRRDKLRARRSCRTSSSPRTAREDLVRVEPHGRRGGGDASGVTGVRIKSTNGGATKVLPVTGFFVAIGHKPNTDLFEGQLEMKNGYIITKCGLEGGATSTSIPGVFAAGTCRTTCTARR
jgi:thioredoxin reductase (NADPH)